MNFYIFRHGETFFSKNDIPYGDQIEIAEIIPEGIPVIEKLARKMKEIPTDANFTSPYKRCLQTSSIVNKVTGKDFKIDDRLHDINSESIENMLERIVEFLEEVKNKNYKNVAICTHGYPIAILRSLITTEKFDPEKLNSYPRTGTLVVIKDGKDSVIDFN